jgi:hypothetical protein
MGHLRAFRSLLDPSTIYLLDFAHIVTILFSTKKRPRSLSVFAEDSTSEFSFGPQLRSIHSSTN